MLPSLTSPTSFVSLVTLVSLASRAFLEFNHLDSADKIRGCQKSKNAKRKNSLHFRQSTAHKPQQIHYTNMVIAGSGQPRHSTASALAAGGTGGILPTGVCVCVCGIVWVCVCV
jgi:hypothetical protein